MTNSQRLEEAVDVCDRWLALLPEDPDVFAQLSGLLAQQGKNAQSVEMLRTGLEKVPHHSVLINDLAWTLATCPEAAIRDGNAAVDLAEKVNQATEGKNVPVLDTLAAAYAEAGRFDDATGMLDKAIQLAKQARAHELVEKLGRRRELYAARQPYRDR